LGGAHRGVPIVDELHSHMPSRCDWRWNPRAACALRSRPDHTGDSHGLWQRITAVVAGRADPDHHSLGTVLAQLKRLHPRIRMPEAESESEAAKRQLRGFRFFSFGNVNAASRRRSPQRPIVASDRRGTIAVENL